MRNSHRSPAISHSFKNSPALLLIFGRFYSIMTMIIITKLSVLFGKAGMGNQILENVHLKNLSHVEEDLLVQFSTQI